MTCDENRRKPRTKLRVCGRSIRKTRRKTSVLKLRSVKCKEISHEMLVLMLQHVSSRVAGFFLCRRVVFWGKLQNLSLLKVSKQVVMPFCVASVARPGIFTCLQRGRKSFCVAGALLLRCFQTMICCFRARRSTLETSDVILRGRPSTLDVSCSLFFANRIVSAARR